jgi:hypothetical protein
MEKELIVLDTDDGVAELKTVTGWVSRHGRFYGDNEQLARYDGCTHKKCECGNTMTKGWTKCENCRHNKRLGLYNDFTFEEWDEIKPICTYDGDVYFFDTDSIEDYLEEHELEPKDLKLVICKPNYTREISDGYWEDSLPEDSDIPKELQIRLDELNKFIKTLEPLSWSPSNVRTEYKRK